MRAFSEHSSLCQQDCRCVLALCVWSAEHDDANVLTFVVIYMTSLLDWLRMGYAATTTRIDGMEREGERQICHADVNGYVKGAHI